MFDVETTQSKGSKDLPYYRARLMEELAHRCEHNPRYSLRAFASSLEIDPGALSRILSGKQLLALKLGKRITDGLALSPAEQGHFINSIAEERKKLGFKRLALPVFPESHPTEIDTDLFRAIENLYHYAILELTLTEDFDSNPRAIAKRLGISPIEAKLATERLLRLGLLKQKAGTLQKSTTSLSVRNKAVSHPALKRQQREILQRALNALENVPIEKRVANSITMSIDPDKIPFARDLITNFCRSLAGFLEAGKRRKVYQLHVNLFPLEKET